MSATHIINNRGGVLCGRGEAGKELARGFVDIPTYRQLNAAGKLRRRTTMNVQHNCGKRPCNCPRRRGEKSGFCADCRRRADGGYQLDE